jgi:hypothetical protein
VLYDHNAYSIGFRDVIAAWLVCFAVAATGFSYAEVSAAPADRVAQVRTAPQQTPPTALRTTVCKIRMLRSKFLQVELLRLRRFDRPI